MSAHARIAIGLIALVFSAAPARAQSLEFVPFVGYRVGGGFYELATGESVDLDGAGSFGLVVNIPFRPDLQIEALVTHQVGRFTLPVILDPTQTRWRVVVDQYQLGGLQEFPDISTPRFRPFLTGTLGLTRYESGGDHELRFSFAAGGGVKLYPTRHLGLRLDTRFFGTLVDIDGDRLACAPPLGVCIGSIDATFVWQAEFTAGVMIRF